MNQVHTVASDKVYQVWDEVKDYLKASIETILNRTKNENSRPLLNIFNKRETVSNLLEQRTPLYESVAHHTINTDRHTVNWSAEQILKIIQNSS